jgi:hypothetical protein
MITNLIIPKIPLVGTNLFGLKKICFFNFLLKWQLSIGIAKFGNIQNMKVEKP